MPMTVSAASLTVAAATVIGGSWSLEGGGVRDERERTSAKLYDLAPVR